MRRFYFLQQQIQTSTLGLVFSLLWTVMGEKVALAACAWAEAAPAHTWVDGHTALSAFHVHHPSGRFPTWSVLHIEGKHPAYLLDQLLSFLQEIRCFTSTLLTEQLLAIIMSTHQIKSTEVNLDCFTLPQRWPPALWITTLTWFTPLFTSHASKGSTITKMSQRRSRSEGWRPKQRRQGDKQASVFPYSTDQRHASFMEVAPPLAPISTSQCWLESGTISH